MGEVPPGTRFVEVRINSPRRPGADGCGEDTLVVRAANVPTEIVALELVSAQPIHVEGLPVTLTAPINDKGTLDSHTATIDWADGTAIDAGSVAENPFGPPGSNAGADGTVTGTHNYADNGRYDVTLCVVVADTATCRTQSIEVTNAVPAVDAGAALTVDEGAFIALASTFSDTGFDSSTIPSEESFTATVDWGDGTVEPAADITLVENPGSAGTPTIGTVQASHAYGRYGEYTITVCVTDDDHAPEAASPVDGQDCDTLTVTVNNVAPTLEAGPDRNSLEGSRLILNPATFSDAGYDSEFTATIDWGDGTTEPPADISVVAGRTAEGTPQTGFVQAFHHYADDGTYTVEVCLNDGREIVCDTMLVTVTNVAPAVDAGPDRIINEGTFITLDPATYTDPGFDHSPTDTQENFTSTIDWGEGTIDVGVLTEAPGAEGVLTTGTVSGSHVYGDDGVYTVTACVTDDDEATTCDAFTVTVINVNPELEEATFLDPAITFLSGNDAFLGRKLVEQTHVASASDSGSDDLRYDWAFIPNPDRFGGTRPAAPETETTTTFNDGSAPGPLPFTDPAGDDVTGAHPHGIFPFSSSDTASVTFTGPGVYTVAVRVTDDNEGTDAQDLPKLVVDECQTTKIVPLWNQFYSDRGRSWAAEGTLPAYLDIVSYASGVFSGLTKADAQALLAPGGNDAKRKALQQALAAWLNFANGSIPWDATVPSGQLYHEAMAAIEAVLLDPSSTKSDYNAVADLGFLINRMHIDNPACEDSGGVGGAGGEDKGKGGAGKKK